MSDSLADEQTWRGRFWFPSEPDTEQRGVLTFDPKRGVSLSLVGGFDEYRSSRVAEVSQPTRTGTRRFPILHGRIGSRAVSLLDCQISRSSSSGFSTEPHEQELTAQRLLVGVFLDDPDAAVFSELTVEIENLSRWDYRGDVQVVENHDAALPLGVEWKVVVSPVAPMSVTVGELTIELGRRYSPPFGDVRRGGLDASSFVASYILVKSSTPKSVAQWGETTKQFQDLITFATDKPCAVISAVLGPSDELRDDEHAEARDEVPLYGRHINVPDPAAPAIEARETFFTLATEGVEFHTLIPRWLAVNNRFRPAFDMILGLRYLRRGYLQSQLITAVAAAESVHAALGFEPPMPTSEFKALRVNLLEVLEDKHQRQWLREKLASNRHTLVDQLVHLAQAPDPEVMKSLVANVQGWAHATKRERNPVAHGGGGSDDVGLLQAVVAVTEAVVIINLLRELGLSAERLRFAVVDNPTLWRAAQLARKQWPVAIDRDLGDNEGQSKE